MMQTLKDWLTLALLLQGISAHNPDVASQPLCPADNPCALPNPGSGVDHSQLPYPLANRYTWA